MLRTHQIGKLFLLPFWLFILTVPCFSQTAPAAPETAPEPEKLAKKYEVHLSFSTESLTGGFGTWKVGSLYLQRKFNDKSIVWANYRESYRRAESDREFVGGFYRPLKKKFAVTAEAMYSPTRKFVGRYSVMGEIEKVFPKGWVGHGGVRYTSYDKVTATTGYGLVEKYWGNNRASYTIYLTKLSNAGTAPNHRLTYNRYYGERVNTVGVAVSFGKEHENLGPGLGILRSNTWSINTKATHWLTESLGVDVSAGLHRQGTVYYRRGLYLGLRYRF